MLTYMFLFLYADGQTLELSFRADDDVQAYQHATMAALQESMNGPALLAVYLTARQGIGDALADELQEHVLGNKNDQ